MTVSEMIKKYFESYNRPDLFGDQDVRFLFNAKLLIHDSKDPISNYINKNYASNSNIIVVDDLNDKLINAFS